MGEEVTIPIWSSEADAYVEFPCETASLDVFRPQTVIRWRSKNRTNRYFLHNNRNWVSNYFGRGTPIDERRALCRSSDRSILRLEDLDDEKRAFRDSPTKRQAVIDECRQKISSYLVVDGGIYTRTHGPALVTRRVGKNSCTFDLNELTYELALTDYLRYAEIAVNAMDVGAVVPVLAEMFKGARFDRDWEAEIIDASAIQDDVAPIGAELAIWAFLCRSRNDTAITAQYLDTVVMVREFMEERWGDEPGIDLDWAAHPRPDMINRLYDLPRKDDETLLPVIEEIAAMLRDDRTTTAALIELAADRLRQRVNHVMNDPITRLSGFVV